MKTLNKAISNQIVKEKEREINQIIEEEGTLKKYIPTKKTISQSLSPVVSGLNDLNLFFSRMGNESADPDKFEVIPHIEYESNEYESNDLILRKLENMNL